MKKIFLTLTLVLFIIPIGISQDLPSYVPTDGLVAFYPFNGNANDVSGNGNHGTVNGATLTTDRYNNADNAYVFDNSNIEIPHQFYSNGWNDYTITLWFLTSDKTVSSQAILNTIPHDGEGLNFNHPHHINVFSHYKSSDLNIDNWDIWSGNEFSINVENNIWYMISIVKHNDEYKYYINNQLISTSINALSAQNQLTGFTIGSITQENNNQENLLGKLDDIGFWNKALSQEEMQNLYTSSSGNILLNGVVSAENNQIKNLEDPTHPQDAVTKSYLQAKIDELILRIENIENGVIPDSPVVFSLGIDSVSGYSTPGNTVTAYAINGDILGTAIAQIESFSNYMILDDFTDRVPTGTNYEKLTYYDTYTDAGSIDGSRFEINRLTTDYGGGILFYGTLELNSQDDKNVFRLSDSDGLPFKFNSFYLDQLESNGTYNFTEFSGTADPGQTVEIYIGGNLFNSTVSDENGEWSIPFDNIPEGSNSIEIIGGVHYGPSLKVTFDNSHEVIFRNELSSIFSFDGDTNLEFFEGFDTSGTKSFNIDKVEWVDFESHYTKAKITDINLDQIDSNFDVSFAPQQTSGSSVLLSSTDEYGTESDKVGVTID